MTDSPDGKRDFFISFNKADRAWATWVAWVLEDAGYTVLFQDWDFSGIRGNFVLEMDRAHKETRRTIVILSPDYLNSRFSAPEWAARFAQDATSKHDLLIPVRVRPCDIQGLLAQVVYLDLIDITREQARERLLGRIARIQLKPKEEPFFPGDPVSGASRSVPSEPKFPVTPSGPALAQHNLPPTNPDANGGIMKPRMFIASSTEHLDLAYAVQEGLEHDVEVTVWTQGVFALSRYIMASLINVLDESDFGLFILAPDDVISMRNTSKSTVRDNVIFELGLFIGRLGADRCFLIVPRGVEDLHLPTDLLGLTPATFDPNRQDGNMVASLGPACNRIRKAVIKLGVKRAE